MMLPPKKGKRLGTENFLRVDSRAARSIDFAARERTIEIEFINGDVYHYYKAPPQLWAQITGIVEAGMSLGTFLNQEFKREVKRLDINYRRVITGLPP